MKTIENNSTVPSVFSFDSHQVRTIDQEGEAWFVASDVCAALDIANVTQAMDRLDEDERSMFNIGRQGDVNIINESGLYSLILKSRKAEAKRFKKWVTSEVLPAIRKTGVYEARPHKTRKALPHGLTCEQQDAVKALVKSRVEVLPQDKRASAAIKCWSSVKTKFGASYKELPPEQFTEVLSLIARLPLEGEYLPAAESPQPLAVPPTNQRMLTVIENGQIKSMTALPDKVCWVDPNDDQSLRGFLYEHLPWKKLPVVIKIASERLDAILRAKESE